MKLFIFIMVMLLPYKLFATSVIVSGDDYQNEGWIQWRLSAESYFYSPSTLIMPLTHDVLTVSQSSEYYYAIAHGYYNAMEPSWGETLYSEDLNKQQFWFAFFGHCDGLCSTAPRTFADSAVHSVGYCEMNSEYCYDCWNNAVWFQEVLFNELFINGMSPQESFDAAMDQYPQCSGCIRYHHNPIPENEEVITPVENVVVNTIIPMLILNGEN